MILAALLAACGNETTTTKTQAPVTESAQAVAAEKAAKAIEIEKEARIAKAAAEKATMAKEAAMKAAEKEAMIAKEQSEKAAMAAEEAAQQEAARTEAARQEAARAEADRQEAARAEAAKQEAARAEAARQETARAEAARQEAARAEAEQAAAAANAYKVLSSGNWSKKTYAAGGNWTLFSENGVTTVSLDSGFSTRKAPDLKIFLSPLSPGELSGRNATQGSLLISPLKSNSGAQSYTVPAGTDLSRYKTILIHCEAFSKLWSVSGI